MNTIRVPVKQRYLSPQAYLQETKRNQPNNNIEQVTFIPPQIGKGGFGKFLVKYKVPVFI